MSETRAFLFDLDGTLADTLPDLAASTNHVRVQYGLPPVGVDAVRGFVGDGARMLLRRALRERRPDEDEVTKAYELYVAHHDAQCTELSRLFDGAAAYLEALRRRGHPVAVAMSAASAYLIGITSEMKLDSTTTSIRSIISNMRFTFSVKSRRIRILLLSMARTEF